MHLQIFNGASAWKENFAKLSSPPGFLAVLLDGSVLIRDEQGDITWLPVVQAMREASGGVAPFAHISGSTLLLFLYSTRTTRRQGHAQYCEQLEDRAMPSTANRAMPSSSSGQNP